MPATGHMISFRFVFQTLRTSNNVQSSYLWVCGCTLEAVSEYPPGPHKWIQKPEAVHEHPPRAPQMDTETHDLKGR